MTKNSAPQFSANPDLAGDLRAAVQIGIADIGASRFRSFDTPEALVQHLQRLAVDIFPHGKTKTAPSISNVSGTQNHSKLF